MIQQRTRIKVCGICDVDMALHAACCGVDAIGLMRVPSSPRYISKESAQQIAWSLPPGMEPVEVFRNQDVRAESAGCTVTLQLHGDESEDQVAEMRSTAPQRLRIIRAIGLDADAVLSWNRCEFIDALLVEGETPGTGQACDLDLLAEIRPALSKPLFLAGGLTPDNVEEAIRRIRPFAVDVSSGVESARGVKDRSLIARFCSAVRNADRTMAEW